MTNFNDNLRERLEDPEFAAHFANAQVESAKELLKASIIQSLTIGSMSTKAIRIEEDK